MNKNAKLLLKVNKVWAQCNLNWPQLNWVLTSRINFRTNQLP